MKILINYFLIILYSLTSASCNNENNEDLKITSINSLALKADDKANNLLLNAKDYGAIGDGVTDDRAALQAALDASATLKRALFIPAGNYLVGVENYNPEESYPNLRMKPGTVVFGSGNATNIIRKKEHVKGYVLEYDAAAHANAALEDRNYTIKDIKFTGATGRGYEAPGATNSDGGFILYVNEAPANKIVIEGVIMENFNKECLAVWGAKELSLRRNRVYNCNHDAYNPQEIEKLIMINNFADGVNFACEYYGTESGSALIEENEFINVYEYGISVEAGGDVKINKNIIIAQTGEITITNQSIGVFLFPVRGTIAKLVISDNTITNFLTNGIANSGGYIRDYVTNQLIIKGNTISNVGINAISFIPYDKTKIVKTEISHNTIFNWNRIDFGNSFMHCAISLYKIDNVAVFNNRINHTTVNGKRNDPLYIYNTSNVRFFDNDCRGQPSRYSSTLNVIQAGKNIGFINYNNLGLGDSIMR